jgi:DnaJ-domain-containing protein 1
LFFGIKSHKRGRGLSSSPLLGLASIGITSVGVASMGLATFAYTSFKRVRKQRRDEHRNDPYVILCAKRSMDNAQLKSAYRSRVSETHPDRVMAKNGTKDTPVEAVRLASERLAIINAAWKRIKDERGI